MKRVLIICCLFLAAMAVYAKGIKEELALREEASSNEGTKRAGYAFGMTVGSDLRQAGLEIDYESFLEGMKAAMEGTETLMDRNEALEIVQDAFENAQRKQNEALRAEEALFLAENATRSGIITTESGLQYQVLEEGSGQKPAANEIVRVHYEGALTNGAIFDSSYVREEPVDIPLDMVIPGWSEGLQLMNVGSKYCMYIPSHLAYGERGAGQIIPPYSTLVFTVELFDIIDDTMEEESSGWDSDFED